MWGGATQEAEIGRILVQGQPRPKVSKIPSQPISQVGWHMSVVPATWEAIGGRITVQASPRQKTGEPI
jgi:hypothetical protein